MGEPVEKKVWTASMDTVSSEAAESALVHEVRQTLGAIRSLAEGLAVSPETERSRRIAAILASVDELNQNLERRLDGYRQTRRENDSRP